MAYLLKDQSRLDGKMALVLIAGLLANMQSKDVSNVVMGTQFYKIAKVNGYGQKAETDADLTAISYMKAAGYNPVGVLTFLERLADHPDFADWGIYQTHPRTDDRVKAVKERLTEMGVKINRRVVTTSSTAMVKPSQLPGEKSFDVIVGDKTICKMTEEDRANVAADRINALFDNKLQIREVKVQGTAVIIRGEPVVEVTANDAMLSSKSAPKLAADAGDALKRVLFKQMLRDMW